MIKAHGRDQAKRRRSVVIDHADDVETLRRRVTRLEGLLLVLMASDALEPEQLESKSLFQILRPPTRGAASGFAYLAQQLATERSRSALARIGDLQKRVNAETNRLDDRVSQLAESFETRLSALYKEVESNESRTAEYATDTARQLRTLNEEWQAFSAVWSLGGDLSDVKLRRYVPVRIFLSESDRRKTRGVENALKQVLQALHFDVSTEFPGEEGSWWKRLFAGTREAMTQPEVIERLSKVERAVELRGINVPQSEVAKNEAEAVAVLLKAIEGIESVAIQTGSVLIVKSPTPSGGARVHARVLTPVEVAFIEKNQRLLGAPDELLRQLGDHCAQLNGASRDGPSGSALTIRLPESSNEKSQLLPPSP